ncbi:MAG: hypothetical protein ACLFU8_00815 [Anaerolineales bacterium]
MSHLHPRKPASSRWLLTGLFLLALLAARPAGAQEGGPEMELQPAWEGLMRKPGWTELRVLLTNEGSPWEGSLQVTGSEPEISYHQPLHLPSHSRKEYRLALPISTVSQVNLVLESTDGSYQQHFTQDITSLAGGQYVCAVVDRLGAQVPGDRAGCDRTLLLYDVQDLPENAMAWETVDLLLLNGVDTGALTEAQRGAMASWVGMGGQLIIGGGAALPRTLNGLPPALRIAGTRGEGAGTNTLTLSSRGEVEVLQEDATGVLALARGLGRGRVEVWGTETSAIFDHPVRRAAVLAPNPATAVEALGGLRLPETTLNGYTLTSMPATVLPSFWQWLLLLLLYVALMGPGTLLLARRLRRPLLAWLLWPLWILVGVLALGLWLGGDLARTFPLVHEVAVVYVPSSELPARVLQGTAIYTPRTGVLRWSAPGGRPRPLWQSGQLSSYARSPYHLGMDVTWLESGAEMERARPQGPTLWVMEGITSPPTISSTLFIDPAGPTVEGTLWSEIPLQDVRLLLGTGSQISLTAALPAQVPLTLSRPLSEAIPLASNYSPYPLPADHRACRLIQQPAPYGSYGYIDPPPLALHPECHLIADAEDVPFPSHDMGGTTHRESCLLLRIPCPDLARGARQIPFMPHLPRGSSGWIDGNTIHVGAPEIIVDFASPTPGANLPLERLALHVQKLALPATTSTTVTLELMLWDWEDEQWIPEPLPPTGAELVLEDERLVSFLSPAQVLRLLLVPDFGGHYHLGEIELTVTVTGEVTQE